jgi:hypothetical protein
MTGIPARKHGESHFGYHKRFMTASRANKFVMGLNGSKPGKSEAASPEKFSGFTLSNEGHLPIDLIDACANHQDIWWAVRSDNRKRISYKMQTKPMVPAQ